VVDPGENTLSGARVFPANVVVQRVEWQPIHFENHNAFNGGPGFSTAANKECNSGKAL
jgi:hypothetical protein